MIDIKLKETEVNNELKRIFLNQKPAYTEIEEMETYILDNTYAAALLKSSYKSGEVVYTVCLAFIDSDKKGGYITEKDGTFSLVLPTAFVSKKLRHKVYTEHKTYEEAYAVLQEIYIILKLYGVERLEEKFKNINNKLKKLEKMLEGLGDIINKQLFKQEEKCHEE